MTSITIALPDDQMRRLTEKAHRLGISPEELVLLGIDELLGRPDEAFDQAVTYVLQKNAELYRRLA